MWVIHGKNMANVYGIYLSQPIQFPSGIHMGKIIWDLQEPVHAGPTWIYVANLNRLNIRGQPMQVPHGIHMAKLYRIYKGQPTWVPNRICVSQFEWDLQEPTHVGLLRASSYKSLIVWPILIPCGNRMG